MRNVISNKLKLPLQISPVDLQRTYGVKMVFENEQQQQKQLHYKIALVYIKQVTNRRFIIEVTKQPIFINEREPDSIVDELVAACGKVIYPLRLAINKELRILEIVNHKQIIANWNTQKEALQEMYEGEAVNQLLERMTATVLNEEKLSRLVIENDWFTTVFFNILKLEKQADYPIMPYSKNIQFAVVQNIIPHTIYKNDIVLHTQGILSDTRSEEEIRTGSLFSLQKEVSKGITGSCDIQYHFYENSTVPNQVIGTFEIAFPSGKSNKVHLEMYHLAEEVPPKEKEDDIAEKEAQLAKEIKEKKKKTRYFLFGKELKI